MNYDQWKTTDPRDGQHEVNAREESCDCCGMMAPLTRCWPYGIETFACDHCRGVDEDENAAAVASAEPSGDHG